MRLKLIPGEFSIARFSPDTEFKSLFSRHFCSITRSTKSVTIVCEKDLMPPGSTARKNGWVCLQVGGDMEFTFSEILEKISPQLTAKQLHLFFVSNFDTDFVLVPAEALEQARSTLKKMGIAIVG